MTPALEQVLADWREQAAILSANGHKAQGDSIGRVCDAVAEAAEPWITWLTEELASLKSGWAVRTLRGKAPTWEDQGMAKREGRRWFFRDCIIPQRHHASAVANDARRAARSATA